MLWRCDPVVGVGAVERAVFEPWMNAMRLDESSTLRAHRYADRFSVVRVEATAPLPDPVRKSSSVQVMMNLVLNAIQAMQELRDRA